MKTVYLIIPLLIVLVSCHKDNTNNYTTNEGDEEVVENKSVALIDSSKIAVDTSFDSAFEYFEFGVNILRENGFFLSTRNDTLIYLKAAKYMQKSIELDTCFISGYENLAKIYYKVDSNLSAICVLDKLLMVDPNHIEAVATKGFILENMCEIEDAVMQYEKALSMYLVKSDPLCDDYINMAFLVLLLHGKKAGIKDLESIRIKCPNVDVELYIKQFENFNRKEFIKDALL